jgi:hypothetical protein
LLELEALDGALNNIEAAAGTGWLEEYTHRIKDVEENKGPRASFGNFTGPGIPPLAYIWYKAREILALGQVLGGVKPGYWGLTAAWLGQNIGKVAGVDGFTSLMDRLKGKEEFRDAYDELYIAAGYLALGAGVSFAAPGGGFTVTPGLRVFCLSEESEAKPKAGRSNVSLQKYEDLAFRLLEDGGISLIYLEVMLGPGEEPEKVLGDMTEKMSGQIKAGRGKLVLVSNIMEGAPGKERLRIWSASVGTESDLSFNIYLPRLTFPI